MKQVITVLAVLPTLGTLNLFSQHKGFPKAVFDNTNIGRNFSDNPK
jgi:hypothetical protein